MRIRKIFWLLFAPVLLVSCWDADDYKNFGMEPTPQSWVLPILNSTITFEDVVERSGSNTLVEEDPSTGVFFMAFRDTLDFANATDQFQLMGATLPLTISEPLVPGFGQVNIGQDVTQVYQIVAGAEIKLIDFLSGTMTLQMQNNYHHRVYGTLTITSLEANEMAYTIDFDLPVFSSSLNDTRPLNDYTLLLHDEVGDTYNTFMVTLNLSIDENLSAPDYSGNLSVNFNFENPDFELIQGMVNQTLSISDQTYEISAFNSTILAEQHFADPYFNFTVENSYGVPIGFTFTSFEVINNNNDVFTIANDGMPGPGDINLSGVNEVAFLQNPAETIAITELKLTKDNSNIEYAFDNAPNKLNFGTDFTLGDASHDRFIKRDSKVSFISDMVLPLHGWAKTHEIGDTIMDMEWPDIKNDYELIKDDYTVTLKFKVTNELPLEIFLQMETLIEVEGVLVPDYFFFVNKDTGLPEEAELAKSATLDANGVSVSSTTAYTTTTLTREEYEQIADSEHLVLKYRFVTGGGGQTNVKILSTNHLQVQMSMLVSGIIEVEF